MCHAEVGERVPLSVSIFFPEKNIYLIFWSADGIGFFAIFGHYINQDFQICSGLLGLVSCGAEHHTNDYVKQKTEEVLLDLGIAKVGHDDGIFKKVADNGSNMVKGWHSRLART